jgi:membrane protein
MAAKELNDTANIAISRDSATKDAKRSGFLHDILAFIALDAAISAALTLARNTSNPPSRHAAGKRVAKNAPGAAADRPSQIPPKGLLQVARRVYTQIGEDRVMAEAAGVTYYSLLAIFPAIAALISIYGLFSNPSTISDNLQALRGIVPDGGMQIISDQVHSLTSAPNKALSLGVIFGLLVSIWSTNAAMKSLFDALNAVYEQHETRSFLHRTWLSLLFTLGALLFVIFAMLAVVALPALLSMIGFADSTKWLLSLGRWPLLLGAIMLFLAALYRYGPSRAKAKWRWVSWGSAFAACAWIMASAGFSWYVANFGSYNKTYGSLGAAVGFMTWIWISAIIILVGAELNAELEHQTARDSTAGPEKPLGTRGAQRADAVAAV